MILCQKQLVKHTLIGQENFIHVILAWTKYWQQSIPFVLLYLNDKDWYDILPFETEEDNLETIETLIATPKPFYTQLFSLVFYKGTELYERAKAQFPEYAKGYLTKDYSVPHRSTINILIRLSTLIDDKDMRRIVNLYKRHGKRIWFMFFICIIEIFATLIITPITYFRVIKLSKNHSYMKTFRILPLYIREGSRRLVNAVKGVSCGG